MKSGGSRFLPGEPPRTILHPVLFNKLIYALAKPVDRLVSWQKGGKMLQVGHPAPDFTVSNHLGVSTTLKEFRGKSVVLWFFPKADTPG